jgi:pyruvate dehydrogenase E1 component
MNQQMPLIRAPEEARRLALLNAVERKLLWLSAWMIHNANHIRPNRDGLKVGGHQASCASVISILTALYFDILKPADRVAIKPHAGPVFHAMNLMLGRQTAERMATLRQFGGIQPYPSRIKDGSEVDFSTGSVGPAGTSPSWAMPSSTRAISTRPCSRAGSTTSAMSGG